MSLKEVSYQGCITKSINGNIVKYFNYLKQAYHFKMYFIYLIKAVFSAFLQSSVSHDLQKSFEYKDLLLKKHLMIINVENNGAI